MCKIIYFESLTIRGENLSETFARIFFYRFFLLNSQNPGVRSFPTRLKAIQFVGNAISRPVSSRSQVRFKVISRRWPAASGKSISLTLSQIKRPFLSLSRVLLLGVRNDFNPKNMRKIVPLARYGLVLRFFYIGKIIAQSYLFRVISMIYSSCSVIHDLGVRK